MVSGILAGDDHHDITLMIENQVPICLSLIFGAFDTYASNKCKINHPQSFTIFTAADNYLDSPAVPVVAYPLDSRRAPRLTHTPGADRDAGGEGEPVNGYARQEGPSAGLRVFRCREGENGTTIVRGTKEPAE